MVFDWICHSKRLTMIDYWYLTTQLRVFQAILDLDPWSLCNQYKAQSNSWLGIIFPVCHHFWICMHLNIYYQYLQFTFLSFVYLNICKFSSPFSSLQKNPQNYQKQLYPIEEHKTRKWYIPHPKWIEASKCPGLVSYLNAPGLHVLILKSSNSTPGNDWRWCSAA